MGRRKLAGKKKYLEEGLDQGDTATTEKNVQWRQKEHFVDSRTDRNKERVHKLSRAK